MTAITQAVFGLGLVLMAYPAAALVAELQPETQPEPCTSHPPAIIELEVQACRPGELAIEEEIAGTRLWWLRPYLESVASSNPGVVVRGRTRRCCG